MPPPLPSKIYCFYAHSAFAHFLRLNPTSSHMESIHMSYILKESYHITFWYIHVVNTYRGRSNQTEIKNMMYAWQLVRNMLYRNYFKIFLYIKIITIDNYKGEKCLANGFIYVHLHAFGLNFSAYLLSTMQWNAFSAKLLSRLKGFSPIKSFQEIYKLQNWLCVRDQIHGLKINYIYTSFIRMWM